MMRKWTTGAVNAAIIATDRLVHRNNCPVAAVAGTHRRIIPGRNSAAAIVQIRKVNVTGQAIRRLQEKAAAVWPNRGRGPPSEPLQVAGILKLTSGIRAFNSHCF
jgi:hypothetical protein